MSTESIGACNRSAAPWKAATHAGRPLGPCGGPQGPQYGLAVRPLGKVAVLFSSPEVLPAASEAPTMPTTPIEQGAEMGKRPYEKPEIKDVGSLEELTQQQFNKVGP